MWHLQEQVPISWTFIGHNSAVFSFCKLLLFSVENSEYGLSLWALPQGLLAVQILAHQTQALEMQAISECFKNFPRSFEVLLVVPVWEHWCRIWDGVSYFSPSPPQLCSGPVTTPILQPCVVSMSTVQTQHIGKWLTASSLEAVHDFSGCNWYLRSKEALESKPLLWMCSLLHLWGFLPALFQLSEDNSGKRSPSRQFSCILENTLHCFILSISTPPHNHPVM